MTSPGMTEWDKLITRACIDLQERVNNHGDWPNGVPATFEEIRKIKDIRPMPGMNNWVLIVESIVKSEAVRIIADTQKVLDETWSKLEDQLFTESLLRPQNDKS